VIDRKKKLIFLAVVVCQVFIVALVVVATTSIFGTGLDLGSNRESSPIVLAVGDNIVASLADDVDDQQAERLMDISVSSNENNDESPFGTSNSNISRTPLQTMKFTGVAATLEEVDSQVNVYLQTPIEEVETYAGPEEFEDNTSLRVYENYGNVADIEDPEDEENAYLVISEGMFSPAGLGDDDDNATDNDDLIFGLFADDTNNTRDSYSNVLEDQNEDPFEERDLYSEHNPYMGIESLYEDIDIFGLDEYDDMFEYDDTLGYDSVFGYEYDYEYDYEYLGPDVNTFELLDWATMRTIIPRDEDIIIYDVETSISFNVRVLALGRHADVEPVTLEDTEAMLETRDGVWSWTARPVWVIIDDRMFPASMNGMPHAGDMIEDNGIDGHFCLWFLGSAPTASTSTRYIRNMSETAVESWNLHPVVIEEGVVLDVERVLNIWWPTDDDCTEYSEDYVKNEDEDEDEYEGDED